MPVQSIDVILRALNGRRFNQELRAAGSSARKMGDEFGQAGHAANFLSAATNAASGTLYAVSAASRAATYGIGALALGVVGLGIQFNSTMEQNELSFKRFVSGGAEGSKEFVKQLIFLAKETPLQLDGVATAARRLLAVQIPESDILKTLKGMADMTSVTGASTDTMLRMAKALGDIHVKGRLMAEEIRQLSNLGVDWSGVLDAGGMKLTQKQLENIGRAGISSTEFFDAWYKGVDKVYGGASKEYLGTFAGQWEKIKDNIKIASGFLTGNMFEGLKDNLKEANKFLDPIVNDFLHDKTGNSAKRIQEKFDGLWKTIGKVGGGAVVFLVGAWQLFMATIKPAQPFFENVLWPLIKGVFKGLVASVVVAIAILGVFFKFLGFIGKIMKPFKGVFEFLGQVIAFVFGGAILKIIGKLSKFGFLLGFIGTAARIVSVPINLVAGAFGFLFKMGMPIIHILSRFPGLIGSLPRLILRAGAAFVNFGTKIKDAIGKVLVWIAVRLPQQMAEKFLNAAVAAKNAFVRGIKGLGKALLTAIFSGGAFVVGIGTSIKDWLNEKTILGDKINLGPLGDIKVPALADGGYIFSGGLTLVGERGPELLNLPTGASVIPRQRPAKARPLSRKMMGDPGTTTSHTAGFDRSGEQKIVKVYIGRRQIAEAVGEEVSNDYGRSRGR